MRNPGLAIVLILIGLLPIAIWGYAAYGLAISYIAAEQGARKVGQAVAILLMIVLALTPSFIGGILMCVGAALLGRKPTGARVVATIGVAIVALTVAVFIAFESGTAHYSMWMAAAVFVIACCGVLVWLWRSSACIEA